MLVSRDPFARTELHKHVFSRNGTGKCDWCGGVDGKGNTYTFEKQSDGGTKRLLSGDFCTVDCLRNYYD